MDHPKQSHPSVVNRHVARLLLRITCGVMLFLHGSHSAIHGIAHVKEMVTRAGLPEFVAYGNLIGELVAPLFLIAGLVLLVD